LLEHPVQWPMLDERLRRVGEWLLVGYTVALVLVTFVVPERPPPDATESSDAGRAVRRLSGSFPQSRRRLASFPLVPGHCFSGILESRSSTVSCSVS
jgi:hypothetical protein